MKLFHFNREKSPKAHFEAGFNNSLTAALVIYILALAVGLFNPEYAKIIIDGEKILFVLAAAYLLLAGIVNIIMLINDMSDEEDAEGDE